MRSPGCWSAFDGLNGHAALTRGGTDRDFSALVNAVGELELLFGDRVRRWRQAPAQSHPPAQALGQVAVCHDAGNAKRKEDAGRSVQNFIEDEGRPLGVGVQAQASNHLKLRG